MEINQHIFRAYDIRGVVPDDLDATVATRIGSVFGSWIRELGGGSVVMGRDNRDSSPGLSDGFREGLLEVGCDVTNIGLCTSPMLYVAAWQLEVHAGVMVTASHNPGNYNGAKLIRRRALPLSPEELQLLRRRVEEDEFHTADRGSLIDLDFRATYLDWLVSGIKLRPGLKVVVDAGNGIAGAFAPEALRRAGCEVVELYCELDGSFPNHLPDPEMVDNVRDLMATVPRVGADLGLGFDGDGDRVGVVDEAGRRYEADILLALVARDFLSRHPGDRVLLDMKCSDAVVADIDRHGGVPILWKTGHALIKRRMHEDSIRLGGEVSGHIFVGENSPPIDDAIGSSLLLLQMLSADEQPSSVLLESVPVMPSTPELKAPCDDAEKFAVASALRDRFLVVYPESLTTDGIRIRFPEGWALIRASNTGPYLTIRLEAQTTEALERYMRVVADALREFDSVSLPEALSELAST